MSKAKIAAAIIALGAGLVPVSAPSSAHEFDASTGISLSYGGGKFKGSVSSSQGSCRSNRRVTVHKKGGGTVGETLTDGNGDWSIASRNAKGRFRASVSAKIRSRYRPLSQVQRGGNRLPEGR